MPSGADLERAPSCGESARIWAVARKVLSSSGLPVLATCSLAGRTAILPRSYYKETLADRQRVLGPDRLDTIAARRHLASAHQTAGKIATALQLHEPVCAYYSPGAKGDRASGIGWAPSGTAGSGRFVELVEQAVRSSLVFARQRRPRPQRAFELFARLRRATEKSRDPASPQPGARAAWVLRPGRAELAVGLVLASRVG